MNYIFLDRTIIQLRNAFFMEYHSWARTIIIPWFQACCIGLANVGIWVWFSFHNSPATLVYIIDAFTNHNCIRTTTNSLSSGFMSRHRARFLNRVLFVDLVLVWQTVFKVQLLSQSGCALVVSSPGGMFDAASERGMTSFFVFCSPFPASNVCVCLSFLVEGFTPVSWWQSFPAHHPNIICLLEKRFWKTIPNIFQPIYSFAYRNAHKCSKVKFVWIWSDPHDHVDARPTF